MEGVSAARLETHRIRQLLNRALHIVENSPHKEEIYQRAGDVIITLPMRLSILDTLLDRTSYALASQGKDFLYSQLSLEDRKVVDDAEDAVPVLPPGTNAPKKKAWSQQPGDLAGIRTFVDVPSATGLPSEHIDQAIGPPHGPRVEYFSRPEMNKGKPETTRIMPEPGEEYGHPWKEDVVKRRTMTASPEKVALMFLARVRQHKTRGVKRTEGIKQRRIERQKDPAAVQKRRREDARRYQRTTSQRKVQQKQYRRNPGAFRRIAQNVVSRYLSENKE